MKVEIKRCENCLFWARLDARQCEPGQFEDKRVSRCGFDGWVRFHDDKCEQWKPKD